MEQLSRANCTRPLKSNVKSTRLDDLTNDILEEILVKVPSKSLFRSKCVSKRWLSLINNPSLARSYVLTHFTGGDKMIVFKINGCVPFIGRVYALPLLDFDRVSSSWLGLMPLTFDFIPPLAYDNYDCNDLSKYVTERLLVDINLMGISGGLVLLRGSFLDQRDGVPCFLKALNFYYYVCNPITKQWVELPQILTDDLVGFTCYYPQQAEGEGGHTRIWADATSCDNIASYDPNIIEFIVLSINKDKKDDVFIIRVFSSTDGTAGWRLLHVPFSPGYRWIRSRSDSNRVLFFNGMFHWCGENCIAVYDPFNKPLECDIIPFPPMDPIEDHRVGSMFLEAFEGRLRMGTSVLYSRFLGWELEEYANKVWVKKIDLVNGHIGFVFQSFVGGAAGDMAYATHLRRSTIQLLDVNNGTLQDFYKYPFKLDTGSHLLYLRPFMSSPWPTPVPLAN